MYFRGVSNELSLYLIICLSSFALSLYLSFFSPLKSMNSWIVMISATITVCGTRFKWVQIGASIVTSTSVSLVKGVFLCWQETWGCVSVDGIRTRLLVAIIKVDSAAYGHCIGPGGHWTGSQEIRKHAAFDGNMDGWHWHRIGDKLGRYYHI